MKIEPNTYLVMLLMIINIPFMLLSGMDIYAQEEEDIDPELIYIIEDFNDANSEFFKRKRWSYQDSSSGSNKIDMSKLNVYSKDGALTLKAMFPLDVAQKANARFYWGTWSNIKNSDIPTFIDIEKFPIIEIRTRLTQGSDCRVYLYYTFQPESESVSRRDNKYIPHTCVNVPVGDPKDKSRWGIFSFKLQKTSAVSRIVGLLLKIGNKSGPVTLQIDWIRARTEEEEL